MPKKMPKKPMDKGSKTAVAKSKKQAKSKKALRDQIDVLAIINALEKHVLGEVGMTATQVKAALALLKKTLPDMTDAPKRTQKDKKSKSHEEALKELT